MNVTLLSSFETLTDMPPMKPFPSALHARLFNVSFSSVVEEQHLYKNTKTRNSLVEILIANRNINKFRIAKCKSYFKIILLLF